MMAELLFLAASVGAPVQAISNAAVATERLGSCSLGGGGIAEEAQIRVSWTVTNPDPAGYTTKVYENGVLVATLTAGETYWIKTISGYVENDSNRSFISDWVYRIDSVANEGGAVRSSATSAEWVKEYGVCP